MKNIIFGGSSFLLPKNRNWAPLDSNFHLTYFDYGDITGPLFKADIDDIVVIVIFFDDLVNTSKLDLKTMQEKYSPLMEAIAYRGQKSNKPTIICWGKASRLDPIRSARSNNLEKKAFGWFVDQFECLQEKSKSLFYVDLNQVFSEVGFQNIFDDRNWYFVHCRVSALGISVLAETLNSILIRCYEAASKVLVLDCDNTI